MASAASTAVRLFLKAFGAISICIVDISNKVKVVVI
jgi:hypothetical protein